MSEIRWEEDTEVKEVIADVRDTDCELNWVLFGYAQGQSKVLTVVGAGNGGLEEMRHHLDDSQVLFAFLQLEEKVYAFIQWCPQGAASVSRARAAIHRSFVTSFLGSISVDILAATMDDITLEKVSEELSYCHSTSGRQLDGSEAQRKLQEQEHRKQDTAKRQALAGNTHEAQKRIATLVAAATGRTSESIVLPKGTGTNVSKKTPPKPLSSTLFEKAKISVELDDEENIKELMLDLREAEIFGDFNWMILTYVEDKKNTLALLETGNRGRRGLVDYLDADHGGARDKVLYILIKEDDSCNKCTFVSWIGRDVPAFQKANFSTHRGAISKWMTEIIHNLQEEYVQSGNDLLGLKDEPADLQKADSASNSHVSRLHEVEKKVQSKPYSGKVLDEVKRDKTPQELWIERKQDQGGRTPPSSDRKHETSYLDSSGIGGTDKEFTQIQLKNRSSSLRGGGRSKYAKQNSRHDLTNVSRRDADCEVIGKSKSELQAAALQASMDAQRLEEEAAMKRTAARKLQEAAMHVEESACLTEIIKIEGGKQSGPLTDDGRHRCDDEGVGGPDSAAPPDELLTPGDEGDLDTSPAANAHADYDIHVGSRYFPDSACLDSLDGSHDSSHGYGLAHDREGRPEQGAMHEEVTQMRELARAKAEAERKAKEAEDFEQARTTAEAEREAKEAVKKELARAMVEAERDAKKSEEREQAKAEAEREAKEAEELELARARAVAQRKVKEAEEREQARTIAEAEREAQEAEERELARARAEAERKRKAEAERAETLQNSREAEERDQYRVQKVVSSLPTSADERGQSPKRSEQDGKLVLAFDGHRPTGSPCISSSVSPKDAFAERKAALLAEAGNVKRGDEDDLRRKAEELLARKRAQLEEASRLRAAVAQHHYGESMGVGGHPVGEAGSDPAAAGASIGLSVNADTAEHERIKRAEIFRQKKMAELASRRGTDVDGAAAAKKAAFLKEAEEAVRRATMQEAARRRVTADGDARP